MMACRAESRSFYIITLVLTNPLILCVQAKYAHANVIQETYNNSTKIVL